MREPNRMVPTPLLVELRDALRACPSLSDPRVRAARIAVDEWVRAHERARAGHGLTRAPGLGSDV